MKLLSPQGSRTIVLIVFCLICFSNNNTFANIDTIYADIPVSQIGSSCVDGNAYPNGISSISNFCPTSSGANAIFNITNPSSGCISYFGVTEGESTGCFEICDGTLICDTIFIFLNTLPSLPLNVLCDTIISPELINISVSDCSSDAEVCLPVRFEVMNTLSISDNGVLYGNGLQGCDMDTTVAYSYGSLIGQGATGPYFLESWTINGADYSDTFPDISALLDSMNLWDTLGNWEFDTIVANTILGGFSDNIYGSIVVSKPGVTNSTVVFGANFGLTPLGSQLSLGLGIHEISVLDTDNSCTDTVTINIACLPNDYLNLETYVNVSGSICVDTSDLVGNFTTLENVCSTSGVDSDIFPNDVCVDWETQEGGIHQLCLVACDDLGFCDTTFITFNITDPQTDTIDIILSENESEYLCIDSTDLFGDINYFNISLAPTFSNLIIDTIDFCLEIESTVESNELACVMICDNQGGCDTTCFNIIVNNAAGFPVAVDDTDTTQLDTPLPLNFVANDTFQIGDSISIISPPVHGVITMDSSGNYSFLPDVGYCGDDVFTYQICNSFGCDQATVSINMICSSLKIYNGFSPNDDGVNDTFMVKGLEAYPNHKISVYNRWGNMVFESENYKSNWDGRWNGKRILGGNYYYVIELNDSTGAAYTGFLFVAY